MGYCYDGKMERSHDDGDESVQVIQERLRKKSCFSGKESEVDGDSDEQENKQEMKQQHQPVE